MNAGKGDDKRRGLGRGLSALLGEDRDPETVVTSDGPTRSLPVEKLRPSPYQPRRVFDGEEMEALVASIRKQGIVQPLLVRPLAASPGEYEIVAGERRWRAAQAAQLHEVPVVVRELGDRDTLEIALVENIQRANLSPLEEAQGYRRLIDEFGHSQDALATALGKSRSHVANTLRLLSLPQSVQRLVDAGRLTAGHARTLVTAAEPERLAQMIVDRDLSVRDAERLAQSAKQDKPTAGRPSAPAAKETDADTLALEHDLGLVLGLKVAIRHEGKGGQLTIHYASLEQLDDVVHRLNITPAGR